MLFGNICKAAFAQRLERSLSPLFDVAASIILLRSNNNHINRTTSKTDEKLPLGPSLESAIGDMPSNEKKIIYYTHPCIRI